MQIYKIEMHLTAVARPVTTRAYTPPLIYPWEKLYLAAITSVIDYLNVRDMPHEVVSAFRAELNNRMSGFKGQFTFDA